MVVWSTNAICLRVFAWWTTIDPDEGVNSPAIPDSSVDFPDAFGPMSAVIAPSGTVNEEGATATVDPNRYSTSTASMAFISQKFTVLRSPFSVLCDSEDVKRRFAVG